MTPHQAQQLARRIDNWLDCYGPSQHVPDSKRHTPRPPLVGAPEPVQKLLRDIRDALR